MEQLAGGFHSGPITTLDVAVQRPIFVTCSREDSSIRIWNYYSNSCEIANIHSVVDDLPSSKAVKPLLNVSIHPTGYYLVASLIDKIRVYQILHNEI